MNSLEALKYEHERLKQEAERFGRLNGPLHHATEVKSVRKLGPSNETPIATKNYGQLGVVETADSISASIRCFYCKVVSVVVVPLLETTRSQAKQILFKRRFERCEKCTI